MDLSCPICLENTASVFANADWLVASRRYRLLKCRACGTAFTDPTPSDSTLEHFYKTSFDYRWYSDHYEAKLRDCRMRILEYGPHLGKRVLDFGGGMGYFSQTASEAGLESITYDPYINPEISGAGGWDSVVALHVLEHSNNPDRTIAQIKDLLVQGGKVVITVPNFESLGYQELGMRWVWAQPPLIHTFHFTAVGLKALLNRHGFGEIEVSYHERWDANLISDLKHHTRQRYLDSLWGMRPLNRFTKYRKLMAAIVSQLRFADLRRARQNYSPNDSSYAELQIVARKPTT